MAAAHRGSLTTRTPRRPPFAPLHKRTRGSLGLAGSDPAVRLSHTHTPNLRTSVDDGAAVVEDDPALVQGGDGVEEVEGPQIPLETPN